MIVKTRNTLTDSSPKTYLTFNEVAGTNIIRWANPNGFAASWGIQVGETGEEQTEIAVLSGGNPANGTAGTLSANTLYAHAANTPVYAVKYDQIVFERSITGTTGAAAPITNGTITIQPTDDFTQFDDTSGSVSYAYKTYFRSSGLLVNSTESDWITSSGFTFYSLARLRERVKEKLWNSDFVDDTTIDNWINEWKDEMTNAAISVNEDYSIGTVNVAFGTNGLGTVTTGDFKQPRRIEVTYNGSDYFLSTKRALNEYYPSEIVNSAHPYHDFQGDTVIHIMPADTTGTAKIWYYQTGTPLLSDADELPQSMHPYTKSFVDYALGMAYQKDARNPVAQVQFQSANNAKAQFVTQLAPRDKTGPTYVRIQEVMSGEDNLVW